MSIAIRSPQIGENDHCLVCGFLTGCDEVPVHVLVLGKVEEISDRRVNLQLTKKLCRPVLTREPIAVGAGLKRVSAAVRMPRVRVPIPPEHG